MNWWVWPFPSGRRRPSLRVGLPWLVSFLGWLAFARVAVDYRALRQHDVPGIAAWLVFGSVVVPVVVAVVSRLIQVEFRGAALFWTVAVAFVATGVALSLLFRDFAAFAFLGGFAVCAAASAAYAVGTSRGFEAWRDSTGR